MTKHQYPSQQDCVWVASDKDGYVAAFVTAGSGPMPAEVLNSELTDQDPEAAISQLPVVSKADLPNSFTELVEKGFFVYDWDDIHRTRQEATNTYNLMATPLIPLKVEQLPDLLKRLVLEVRFREIVFSQSRAIDVSRYFKCETDQAR